ncbi:MAG: ATP-dependent zinc metalloprotease FtsH [Clostridia bacterium]|nr:ATP-dependent zinc metalloprotease FtsH [Clostridia bacterium]
MNEDKNKKRFKLPNTPWFYIILALAIMMVVNLTRITSLMNGTVTTTTYSEFLNMLDEGRVQSVEVGSTTIIFTCEGNTPWQSQRYEAVLVDDPNLVSRLVRANVAFSGASSSGSFLDILIGIVLPLAFYAIMIFWIFRLFRGGSGGIGAMNFGKSSAKLYEISDASKKFTDVAGQDEAKEALVEIVDFLHEPAKYKAIGAKLPRGALLVGPPGTGKTLIAQAVAGEANVPFFFVSGSAFVEMFVGTGAARVRDLFKQASEKAPCIVFIDEIDAIGKKRDNMGISSNDEREQALNQLLAEMDGFDPSKGIVVLGATNRPEILDKALLRPGRFDRRITVDLPDLKGREAVLKVHARNIVMDPDIDFASVAKATVGASGADLANIINEAALRAVKMGRKSVIQEDLEASVDVVIAGSERKSLVIPEKERRMIACHEIGHALVAALQKNSAPVHKITIIPRTSGALGYTMQVDEDEHVLLSKENLLAKLAVLAAGRASEEFMFDSCTTGASNDIEQMTRLARSMVTRFGMSAHFGMMALETGASAYLGTDGQLACSIETATKIDDEVKAIIKGAFDSAMAIIRENSARLTSLSQALLDRETLTGEEFMQLLNQTPAVLEAGEAQE